MRPVQTFCTPKENDTMNRALKALLLLLVLVGTYAGAGIGPTLNDGNPIPIRIRDKSFGPTLNDGNPLPICDPSLRKCGKG
jgi:hypothetical protein